MFTILIVEDEAIEREALRIIISNGIDFGIDLLEAATGTEAINIIDSKQINLILLDINIPHPSGIEVLRYLRGKNADTKVIVTTAIDDFDTARNMIGLKVDEYLLKPIRPKVLIDHIKSFLEFDSEKHQQNKALSEQLINMLNNNLYTDWMQVARDYIDWVYSQQKYSPQERISEFVDIIKGVAERNRWSLDSLKKQIDQLKNMSFSQQNYYKVLNIILNLSTILFDEAQKQLGHNIYDPMQKALHYIERNLGKNLSLDDVADKSHVTPSYLSRLFKKNKGINFVAYLKQRRMEIAKNLLDHSDMSVASIAIELSYNDSNYFGRAFKEQVGLTPSEYRARTKD